MNIEPEPKTMKRKPSLRNEPKNEFAKPMSDRCREELMFKYSRMPVINHSDYVGKKIGLMMCGLSEKEAEKMCRPKKVSKKIQKQRFIEYCKQEQKELEKLNRLMKKELEAERLAKLWRS